MIIYMLLNRLIKLGFLMTVRELMEKYGADSHVSRWLKQTNISETDSDPIIRVLK
jgi:hypothetical protein